VVVDSLEPCLEEQGPSFEIEKEMKEGERLEFSRGWVYFGRRMADSYQRTADYCSGIRFSRSNTGVSAPFCTLPPHIILFLKIPQGKWAQLFLVIEKNHPSFPAKYDSVTSCHV
jgi:hypothetical protein